MWQGASEGTLGAGLHGVSAAGPPPTPAGGSWKRGSINLRPAVAQQVLPPLRLAPILHGQDLDSRGRKVLEAIKHNRQRSSCRPLDQSVCGDLDHDGPSGNGSESSPKEYSHPFPGNVGHPTQPSFIPLEPSALFCPRHRGECGCLSEGHRLKSAEVQPMTDPKPSAGIKCMKLDKFVDHRVRGEDAATDCCFTISFGHLWGQSRFFWDGFVLCFLDIRMSPLPNLAGALRTDPNSKWQITALGILINGFYWSPCSILLSLWLIIPVAWVSLSFAVNHFYRSSNRACDLMPHRISML